MFVLLVPTEDESGFLKRMRSPKIKLTRIEMRNAAPFFVMTCPKYRGTLPYNTISAVAGEMRDRIVFPKNVKLQDTSPVKPFESRKLKRRLIFNTALEALRENSRICEGKTVSIVDTCATYRNEIDKFVTITEKIEVITLFPEKYEPALKRLDTLGAKLSLKQGEKVSRKDGVIISDKADCAPHEFEGVIFANAGEFPPNAECITGEGIDLSEYTDFEFPPCFDTLDIAEAMYTLNFAGKLGEKSYSRICPPVRSNKMNIQTDKCK